MVRIVFVSGFDLFVGVIDGLNGGIFFFVFGVAREIFSENHFEGHFEFRVLAAFANERVKDFFVVFEEFDHSVQGAFENVDEVKIDVQIFVQFVFDVFVFFAIDDKKFEDLFGVFVHCVNDFFVVFEDVHVVQRFFGFVDF